MKFFEVDDMATCTVLVLLNLLFIYILHPKVGDMQIRQWQQTILMA